jgi:hypothetical protein
MPKVSPDGSGYPAGQKGSFFGRLTATQEAGETTKKKHLFARGV